MSAYLIVRAEVSDSDRYAIYARHTPRLIAAHGGRFIARGGSVETIEGDEEHRRVVVVEFPDAGAARAFYHSDDYQKIVGIRHAASESQMILVDGFPDQEWADAVAASAPLSIDDDPDIAG